MIRGEVTIEHTLEVMVAHSESVIENCMQRFNRAILNSPKRKILVAVDAIMLRACKASYSRKATPCIQHVRTTPNHYVKLKIMSIHTNKISIPYSNWFIADECMGCMAMSELPILL